MCSFLSCMWDVLLEEIYQGMVDLPGVIRVHVDLHVESNGSCTHRRLCDLRWMDGCHLHVAEKHPKRPFFRIRAIAAMKFSSSPEGRSDTVLLSWTTTRLYEYLISFSRQLDHNNTSAASQSVVGAEQILTLCFIGCFFRSRSIVQLHTEF